MIKTKLLFKNLFFILIFVLFNINSLYASVFKISGIKVVGLKKVDEAVVLNALAVDIGDNFDTANTNNYIRNIYKTGYFKSITINRSKNNLYIYVKEKPSISRINIIGNTSLDEEKLKQGLSTVDIKLGSPYDEFTLQKITQEIEQQYLNQGKYAVRVKSDVKVLDKDRVEIKINISEGKVAKIKQIKIIGNKSFSESSLLSEFDLTEGSFISWFTFSDRYSKQKLQGDIEKLKSFYLNRGYLNFKVDDVQISLTPDKKQVYITIQINEGSVYKIGKVNLGGRAVLNHSELKKYIFVKSNENYSAADLIDSESAMLKDLGSRGYLFARVDINKNINEANKTVDIIFFVSPGNRVYVRRIDIVGNVKTQDEVMRREVLQMESGVISKEKIELSKQRLYQLGYVKDVNVETIPVPGTSDQVDLKYTLAEASTGHFSGGIGYSEDEGIMFQLGLSQDNFFGTGQSFSSNFNKTPARTSASISYFEPYFTIDGIGLGYSMYYDKANSSKQKEKVSKYKINQFGGSLSLRIPLSLYDVLNFSQGMDHKEIEPDSDSATQINKFVIDNGKVYNNYPFSVSWNHNKLDRALLPTSGWSNQMGAVITQPFSDLKYYSVYNTSKFYKPVYNDFILHLRANVAYGDGYSGQKLPFFEHYYAGGINSVRGFNANSLGPKDSKLDPYGGNSLLTGSVEMFLPKLMAPNAAWRPSIFIDAGNVFANEIKPDQARVSTGIGVQWVSPLGPLNVSYAIPVVKRKGDSTKAFNFSVSSNF